MVHRDRYNRRLRKGQELAEEITRNGVFGFGVDSFGWVRPDYPVAFPK